MSVKGLLDFPDVKPEDKMMIFDLYRNHIISMVDQDKALEPEAAEQIRKSLSGAMDQSFRQELIDAIIKSLAVAYEAVEKTEGADMYVLTRFYSRFLRATKTLEQLIEVHRELCQRDE